MTSARARRRLVVQTVVASEAGSSTVALVGALAATVALLGMLVPLLTVMTTTHRIAAAADSAALAAADTAVGIVPGSPCDQARAVAAANRSELVGCTLDGLIATVQVETTIIGLRVVAHATAGPASPTQGTDSTIRSQI